LDLSGLWQWSVNDPDAVTMTHLYRPLGGPPVPEQMNARDYFLGCLQEVRSGRVIRLGSLDEAPAEAARDREMWRHYGIKAVLNIPLSAGGGPRLGAVSFHTVLAERAWPAEIVQRLTLVAQVFASALARKRLEHALRESEARLSLAADSAEVGLWVLDCATGVIWATERALANFGYAPGEMVSRERFEALVHPDDLELARRTIEPCFSGCHT
jgi:PAS domain-containing protein